MKRTFLGILFISLFVYSFIRLFSPWPVAAQEPPPAASPWYSNTLEEFGQILENTESVHKEGYDVKTQVDLENALSCQIMGCSKNPEHTFYYGKSAIASLNNYIAMIYANPPADLALWIRDTGQTLGFVPRQAYAQGIGFSGLAALLPIWKAFRNIAYLLLAVVMIVIGFMVMFRKKIDPKTVVTVQNALPKIVVTLLLVTFSYAIVGIMVDLMYLAILLAVGIFKSTELLPDPAWIAKALEYDSPESLYSQGGTLTNIWNLFGPSAGIPNVAEVKTGLLSTGEVTNLILWGSAAPVASAISSVFLVGGLILALFQPAAGSVVAGLGVITPIISSLVSLALLFLIIRLFIFFLSSYIQVILALIFSPLQIVFEAIPGSSSFSNWLKNLIANLSVFPVGAIIFMLSAVFAKFSIDGTGRLWTPPFSPLISTSATSISALLALAILFTIPNIASSIKEALKAKPVVQAGIIGGIIGPFGAGAQMLFTHWLQQRTMERAMQRVPTQKERISPVEGPKT